MTTECVHHWIIATSNGPTSMGQCQRCHAVKEFKNTMDYGSAANWKLTSRKSFRNQGQWDALEEE